MDIDQLSASTLFLPGLVDENAPDTSKIVAGQFKTAKSMFAAMKSHSLDEEIGEAKIEKTETGVWGVVQREIQIKIFSQQLAEARLARIAQLTQLEELQLKGSAVDNLEFLLPLVNLHKLTLANTRVRELSRLKNFPHLQKLEIIGDGELKPDSLHALQVLLPKLDINVDGARLNAAFGEGRGLAESAAKQGLTPDQVQQLLGPARGARPASPKDIKPQDIQQILNK